MEESDNLSTILIFFMYSYVAHNNIMCTMYRCFDYILNSLISKSSFIYKIGIHSFNSDLSFTLFLN